MSVPERCSWPRRSRTSGRCSLLLLAALGCVGGYAKRERIATHGTPKPVDEAVITLGGEVDLQLRRASLTVGGSSSDVG